MVRKNTIDLFRHRTIERSTTGFDVRQRYAQLGGDHCSGQRRIRVAVDDHAIRLFLYQNGLQPAHHLARLHALRCRPDAKSVRRLGDLELVKENVGHVAVVMLARMNDGIGDTKPCQHGSEHRGFYELRARTDHGDRSHAALRAEENSRITSMTWS